MEGIVCDNDCILQINHILSFEEITLKFIGINEPVSYVIPRSQSFNHVLHIATNN